MFIRGGSASRSNPSPYGSPVHVHSYVKILLSLSKPLDWRVYEESPNRLCFLGFQILQLLRSQSFQIHWGLKNEFLSGGACPLRPRFNKIRFVDVSLNVSINVNFFFFLIWVGDCSPNLGCNLSWYCDKHSLIDILITKLTKLKTPKFILGITRVTCLQAVIAVTWQHLWVTKKWHYKPFIVTQLFLVLSLWCLKVKVKLCPLTTKTTLLH